MKNLKALSFFSGAMGLDLGLKKAGIDIILACESEKFIRETIKLNNPKLKVLEDINLGLISPTEGFQLVKSEVEDRDVDTEYTVRNIENRIRKLSSIIPKKDWEDMIKRIYG